MRTFMPVLVVAALSVAASKPVDAGFITDGLAVYYDSRDMTINGVARGTGNPWLDRQGNDNNINVGLNKFASATLDAGDVYAQAGQSGGISGTQDVLAGASATATNGINVPGGLTGITVELLFRAPKLNAQNVLTKGAGGDPNWRVWTLEEVNSGNGDLWFGVHDGSTGWFGAYEPLPDDQWVHVIGVWGDRDGNGIQTSGYDESLVRLFYNGVEVGTGSGPTSHLNDFPPGIPSLSFNGPGEQLAFARFYTRALNTEEIAANWADAQGYFVPEPSAGLLAALALAGLGAVCRRRRSRIPGRHRTGPAAVRK